MTTHITRNTLEGTARPLSRKRQKRESRASSSGFAKRVWKSDGGRLTELATGSGWARFRLFN